MHALAGSSFFGLALYELVDLNFKKVIPSDIAKSLALYELVDLNSKKVICRTSIVESSSI